MKDLPINSVQLCGNRSQSIYCPTTLSDQSKRNSKLMEILALIDCGAGGNFIDPELVKRLGLTKKPLKTPIRALNADGTENGTSTHYCPTICRINGKNTQVHFKVISLGRPRIIIGLPWLKQHNPNINWKESTLTWRNEKTQKKLQQLIQTISTNDIQINRIAQDLEDIEINVKTSSSHIIAQTHGTKQEDDPRKVVPKEFHQFLKIFDKKASECFPSSRPWDHKIDLKNTFKPVSMKPYRLSPTEEQELNKFIDKNLEKGYIRPSESPMASPYFFVGKKDGKLRPCQDYRYLNEHTIKTPIPFPSFPLSSTNSRNPNGSQNSTFVSDTTTFASKTEINGKQPSKRTVDYSNQQLCSLACVTPQPPFKR